MDRGLIWPHYSPHAPRLSFEIEFYTPGKAWYSRKFETIV